MSFRIFFTFISFVLRVMLENFTQQEIMRYWQKGFSIADAINKFCDRRLLEKYQQPLKENSNVEMKPGLSGFLEGLNSISQDSHRVKNIQSELYQNLSKQILAGKLIATGYQSPIQSDSPTVIPAHMWPPEKVGQRKSTISAHDIQFVRVRISKKRAADRVEHTSKKAVEAHPPDTAVKNKKAGRPSRRKEIKEAYQYLKENGRIDYSKSLLAHIDLIQDTVRQLYPEITGNAGMQYEVIRLTIGEQFQAAKDNL